VPERHQWPDRWYVKLRSKKPTPMWIVTNVFDNSCDRCFKLEYEDSHSSRWWLSKSGCDNFNNETICLADGPSIPKEYSNLIEI